MKSKNENRHNLFNTQNFFTMKAYLKAIAILIAIILTTVIKISALEVWRPDKQIGYPIVYEHCLNTAQIHCATVYEDNSSVPIFTINGWYFS